jgi:hypothetical protein
MVPLFLPTMMLPSMNVNDEGVSSPVTLSDQNSNLLRMLQSVSVESSKMEVSAKWGTSKSNAMSCYEAGKIRG